MNHTGHHFFTGNLTGAKFTAIEEILDIEKREFHLTEPK